MAFLDLFRSDKILKLEGDQVWDRSFRADGCAEEIVFAGGLENARKGRNCLVERILQVR